MAKIKETPTPEQIYKKNRKISRTFRVLSPTILYLFLLLSLLFAGLMLRNSVGNIVEILELLDDEVYSGTEVREHYKMLVERWGEWTIVGDEENSSLVIKYIDIGNALFSGMMITYCVLFLVSFAFAIIFGKIVFPLLAKHYESSNAELVNITSLQSAAQIAELSKKKGEWF